MAVVRRFPGIGIIQRPDFPSDVSGSLSLSARLKNPLIGGPCFFPPNLQVNGTVGNYFDDDPIETGLFQLGGKEPSGLRFPKTAGERRLCPNAVSSRSRSKGTAGENQLVLRAERIHPSPYLLQKGR